MAKGLLVTVAINGAHPKLENYPLLPDDLVFLDDDGTYGKEAPGLGVMGFVLTPDQVATLKEVEYTCFGLDYKILSDS